MSDKAVERLVDNIENQQRKFVRALDSSLRKSVLRGPGGEIELEGYLDDFKEDISRFSDRFDGDYSASAEVKDLLARAEVMNNFIHANPSVKGANEWDVLGSSLQQLAAVYGTTFPLPDDPVIRRIGDGELEDSANATSKFAKHFRGTVRDETRRLDELEGSSAKLEDAISSLEDVSKTLASRIRRDKPASAEARQLLDTVDNIEALLATPGMPLALKTAWAASGKDIEKIAQAFRL
jgi:Mg2+ and Co2+ transporter CorA